MLAASVVAWRREADGAAGRPRSGLEAAPGAPRTRQSAPRAHEIVASTIAYNPVATCPEPRAPMTASR